MTTTNVSTIIQRLRAAADQVGRAFPQTIWQKISGPGPAKLEMNPDGYFSGLDLQPGKTLRLRCELKLPAEVGGVPLAGEPLEGMLNALYPTDVLWNGKSVFSDNLPVVATGPGLFTIIPQLKKGRNGAIEFRIHSPNFHMTKWVSLRFSTPSLRARFELLDIAYSQLALADAVAATDSERAAVAKAASLVPEKLVSAEHAQLTAALRRVTDALLPLQKKLARLRIHIIGHSHIDMNWLWTWPDTVEVIKRDFRNVLALMDEFPELKFTHSQPATYEVIRRHEPQLFAHVQEQIKRGRWEPATMQWVEPDVNMPSGEAHARQLLEAVHYSREHLGMQPSTFLSPDTFGHAGNLPQLAVSAGAQRYYHHRANPGQANQWPAYWWEGQDGTRLLAISTHTYNGGIQARDLAFAALRALKHGYPCDLHFHGIGDHGGGPARQYLEALRRFQQTPLLPTAFCSTLAEYTKELLESGVALPVHRGESSTIFEGCYTTHADTKRYNRHGENLLTTADTLAALAGQNHNNALTEAWRKVLFHQFHDILDGSAIHEAYEMTAKDFSSVQKTAAGVTNAALDVLESGITPGKIAVTNPLGVDRTDIVLVRGKRGKGSVWLVGDHGHVTPGQFTRDGLAFVARVPAFGTVGYRLQTKPPRDASSAPNIEVAFAYGPNDPRSASVELPKETDAPYYKVETPLFRVFVGRDTGILLGLFDKRVGRELVGYGLRHASDYMDSARPDLAMNVLQFIEEDPHGMSAWQLHEVRSETNLITGAKVRIVESGPVRCVLEAVRDFRKSKIRQRLIFYRELSRIDFDLNLDWQEIGDHKKGVPGLKVAFTVRLPECEAWFETPFAAVQRPADGQEVPALRWADVGGDSYGIALLNESKYGHDILGSRLRLTLVRSPYDPDPIPDVGRHEIRYSLVPHPGNWRDAGIVEEAAAFNQPLLAREVKRTVKRAVPLLRLKLDGDSTAKIACLKNARDGSGVIIRLYETAGKTAETKLVGLPPNARVWETNIVEDPQRELPVANGNLPLTFRPWQIRTLRVKID